MAKFKYKAGDKFNHWKLIEYAGNGKWLAECDCGNKRNVFISHITKGNSKSCGSLTCTVLTRGSHRRTHTTEYRIWNSAKQRCINPNNDRYKDYGGAGVIMCDRWLNSFENFLCDMGEKPDKHSLDRVNPFGNYEPSNCRWATAKEQQNNRRSQAVKGYSIAAEAEKAKLPYKLVSSRLQRGWSLADATTIPLIKSDKIVRCKESKDIKLRCTNKSGVRGVHQNKRSGKWVAQITVAGKVTTVGTFKTIEEAEVAITQVRVEADKISSELRKSKKDALKQQSLSDAT